MCCLADATIVQLRAFPVEPSLYDELIATYPVAYATREELLEGSFPKLTGLICTILDPVDSLLLDCFPQLKVIANYGAGVNHIDLAEAAARRIQVTNTPGVLSDATAELTWGLILDTCRRISESDRILRHQGFSGWTPDYHLGMEVTGKTLGILGLGDIGKAVAKRAKGFDMPVIYHNRTRLAREKETALGVSYRDFNELLAESHILSIHAPLTSETRGLFNADTLAKMRPQSVLINTARGEIVDESALVEALQSGHLYSVGLDVFEQEPDVHPELKRLDNVVLTAHIGSATLTTRRAMGNLVLKNMTAVLSGGQPITPVSGSF